MSLSIRIDKITKKHYTKLSILAANSIVLYRAASGNN
jgi:hypothetical protein